MTYEEMYQSMTRRERIAAIIMCYMRTNEEGFWTTCFLNKIISKIASAILRRNVFDWELDIAERLDEGMSDSELDELKIELEFLKTLLA